MNIFFIIISIGIASLFLFEKNNLDIAYGCSEKERVVSPDAAIRFFRQQVGSRPPSLSRLDGATIKSQIESLYSLDNEYKPEYNTIFPAWNVEAKKESNFFYRETMIWSVSFTFRMQNGSLSSTWYDFSDCGYIISYGSN